MIATWALGASAAYLTATAALAASGLLGTSKRPSLQTLSASSGAALVTATAGAVKNSIFDPDKKFYTSTENVNLSITSKNFAGLSPTTHAALLYSAFNAGSPSTTDQSILEKPTSKAWDASAPLGDKDFDKVIKPLAFENSAQFEFVAGVRQFDKGGLGAVAYREKETGKIHVFVVGLETDKASRDTLPDLKSLLYGGMQQQTEELKTFIEGIRQQYPDQLASITGQSLGTIPAAKVSYEINDPSVQTILVEPRMNADLAKELFPNDTESFTKWYQENTVSMVVGANAWNSFRVQSLGESPNIPSQQSYVFTGEDGHIASGLPLIGLNIIGSPHQASKSVLSLAYGKAGLIKVDPETLPVNAAETLQARGSLDVAGAGVLGLAAAGLTAGGMAAGVMALQKMQQRARG